MLLCEGSQNSESAQEIFQWKSAWFVIKEAPIIWESFLFILYSSWSSLADNILHRRLAYDLIPLDLPDCTSQSSLTHRTLQPWKVVDNLFPDRQHMAAKHMLWHCESRLDTSRVAIALVACKRTNLKRKKTLCAAESERQFQFTLRGGLPYTVLDIVEYRYTSNIKIPFTTRS